MPAQSVKVPRLGAGQSDDDTSRRQHALLLTDSCINQPVQRGAIPETGYTDTYDVQRGGDARTDGGMTGRGQVSTNSRANRVANQGRRPQAMTPPDRAARVLPINP